MGKSSHFNSTWWWRSCGTIETAILKTLTAPLTWPNFMFMKGGYCRSKKFCRFLGWIWNIWLQQKIMWLKKELKSELNNDIWTKYFINNYTIIFSNSNTIPFHIWNLSNKRFQIIVHHGTFRIKGVKLAVVALKILFSCFLGRLG
jgi:hypothetical protein